MYKKDKRQVLCDAVCGVLILLSILVYILLGVLDGNWHPGWLIVVCTGLICAVISICVSTYVRLERERKAEERDRSNEEK